LIKQQSEAITKIQDVATTTSKELLTQKENNSKTIDLKKELAVKIKADTQAKIVAAEEAEVKTNQAIKAEAASKAVA